LAARVAEAEKVPAEEQAKAIADMQRQMGQALMERRGPASLPNTQQGRDTFVREAGGAEYAELARYARLANPALPPAALADKHVLEMYAATGKYAAARNAARSGRS